MVVDVLVDVGNEIALHTVAVSTVNRTGRIVADLHPAFARIRDGIVIRLIIGHDKAVEIEDSVVVLRIGRFIHSVAIDGRFALLDIICVGVQPLADVELHPMVGVDHPLMAQEVFVKVEGVDIRVIGHHFAGEIQHVVIADLSAADGCGVHALRREVLILAGLAVLSGHVREVRVVAGSELDKGIIRIPVQVGEGHAAIPVGDGRFANARPGVIRILDEEADGRARHEGIPTGETVLPGAAVDLGGSDADESAVLDDQRLAIGVDHGRRSLQHSQGELRSLAIALEIIVLLLRFRQCLEDGIGDLIAVRVIDRQASEGDRAAVHAGVGNGGLGGNAGTVAARQVDLEAHCSGRLAVDILLDFQAAGVGDIGDLHRADIGGAAAGRVGPGHIRNFRGVEDLARGTVALKASDNALFGVIQVIPVIVREQITGGCDSLVEVIGHTRRQLRA